jgi:predicted ABC-type ATPase
MTAKRIIIIAGPNGAGKTTFATELLPNEADCPVFINADLIAAGLSPFQPELAAIKAGRLMLREMAVHVARGESFAFETTLAGTRYARSIPRWQQAGYHVTLIFLSLPSSDMAIQRVAQRIRQGGHAVPIDVIRRRFVAGRRNFERLYRDVVDDWAEYDNSGPQPRLIDWKGKS